MVCVNAQRRRGPASAALVSALAQTLHEAPCAQTRWPITGPFERAAGSLAPRDAFAAKATPNPLVVCSTLHASAVQTLQSLPYGDGASLHADFGVGARWSTPASSRRAKRDRRGLLFTASDRLPLPARSQELCRPNAGPRFSSFAVFCVRSHAVVAGRPAACRRARWPTRLLATGITRRPSIRRRASSRPSSAPACAAASVAAHAVRRRRGGPSRDPALCPPPSPPHQRFPQSQPARASSGTALAGHVRNVHALASRAGVGVRCGGGGRGAVDAKR